MHGSLLCELEPIAPSRTRSASPLLSILVLAANCTHREPGNEKPTAGSLLHIGSRNRKSRLNSPEKRMWDFNSNLRSKAPTAFRDSRNCWQSAGTEADGPSLPLAHARRRTEIHREKRISRRHLDASDGKLWRLLVIDGTVKV